MLKNVQKINGAEQHSNQNIKLFFKPVNQQVLLHPETVGAAVTPSTVAVGASGGARVSRVGGRIFIITIQIRHVSSFAT